MCAFSKPKVTYASATPAAPAVSAPLPETKTQIGGDTVGASIKRRSHGKRGLMVQPVSSTAGSSTGLNI